MLKLKKVTWIKPWDYETVHGDIEIIFAKRKGFWRAEAYKSNRLIWLKSANTLKAVKSLVVENL